jgi:hypothetical protein
VEQLVRFLLRAVTVQADREVLMPYRDDEA